MITRLKHLLIHVLLLCWSLTAVFFMSSLLSHAFRLDVEAITDTLIYTFLANILIMSISFMFFQVLHPKSLLRLLKGKKDK